MVKGEWRVELIWKNGCLMIWFRGSMVGFIIDLMWEGESEV